MLSSVRPPRVYEQIVTEIERAIYDGKLQQGDKLPPERQLVRQFNASRVAVREALRALEHRGLVEVRQGSAGGHFIRELDAGPLLRDFQTLFRMGRVSLDQLIEARRLIEPEAARLAAFRATEADLKALGGALDERGAAGRHPRAVDIEFHRLVAAAARNPVHAVVTHALLELEAHVVAPRLELVDADRVEVDLAHRRIFAAIAERTPEAAQAAMAAHIGDVERRLGMAARGRAAS
ncbi:MAG TPA: GntR family transcriptional regulator [Methylomirabilota bacterium]|nr:GntR family transcriptional regulator [Methylomirabilota bacterium]